MNLTDNTKDKKIKVIVEVDGNVIDTTPKTNEKKKANNYYLILLLAIISTFAIFPESKETINNYLKQYEYKNYSN